MDAVSIVDTDRGRLRAISLGRIIMAAKKKAAATKTAKKPAGKKK